MKILGVDFSFKTGLKELKDFKNAPAKQLPIVYAKLYIYAIPLFYVLYLAIYAFIGVDSFRVPDEVTGFRVVFDFFYFSIVTITTLGYGEITPIHWFSQLLVSIQVLSGITLFGLMLNSLSHQHSISIQDVDKQLQEEKEEREAVGRFIAYYRLIGVNVKIYFKYAYLVTTPIEKRQEQKELNQDFEFSDMRDLYKPSYSLTDDITKPSVTYFLKSHEKLIQSFEDLIKSNYLERWPELEHKCLIFIHKVNEKNCNDFINYGGMEPKIQQAVNKKIGEYTGEVDYLESGDTLNPYIGLYFMIKETFEFLDDFNNDFKDITNE